MADWVLLVPAERYAEERLYRRDRLPVPVGGAGPGDRVALVAGVRPPVVFGLGRVSGSGGVAYTRRLFDAPLPAEDLPLPAGDQVANPLDRDRYARLEQAAGTPGRKATWLVSVDLPIEAESRGEAVRQFWSYLRELGPRELPAYVSPLGDELAMQAYVLGAETNLDPEEDD